MSPRQDAIKTHERLAVLEEKLDSHIADEEETMATLVQKLDRIESELSRYRGFIGGILLMVTAVVTFFKLFGEQVASFLRG